MLFTKLNGSLMYDLKSGLRFKRLEDQLARY
jgi:hypothetical protein